MTRRRRLAVIVGAGALYLVGIGFVSGIAVERMRFDGKRAAVLARLTSTQARLHGHVMELERATERRSFLAER
jgi:hypothetical protein